MRINRLETCTVFVMLVFVVLTSGAYLYRGRAHAKQMACRMNVRVGNQSILNYAQEHDGDTASEPTGNWLWDASYATTDILIDYGAHRHAMYCPSAKYKSADNAAFWQFAQAYSSIPDQDPIPLFQEPTDTYVRKQYFRVLGYVYLIRRMNENQPYEVRNVNEVEIPHEKELVADAILSVSANGGFHDIQAGAMSVWGIADQSNHLNEAEVPMPLGGNTGFVDGHVAWRPFEDMQIQHSAYMPYFWW